MKRKKGPSNVRPHRQAEAISGEQISPPVYDANTRHILHKLQKHQEKINLINQELEAAFRQYTDLYDFAPIGYLTLTRAGMIQQANLAGAHLLGVEHDELTLSRLASFVSDESTSTFEAFWEKLLSGKGKETCELVFEKKENGPRWARLEASCFDGGEMSRAMLTDITERKHIEQALQESENRFRTTLQDAPSIAVQGYTIDGTTQYWNSASEKLYGYSAQEAVGKNLLELIIPPEMRSEVRRAIQQMAETGEPIPPTELSLMKKDGSRVDVYSSHTIFSAPGRLPELFCMDVDLTERKQIEAVWQSRLHLNQFADSHSIDELLQKALDEAEQLTASQIGFAHFLDADQKTLKLQMWSTNTLQYMCSAEGRGKHYSVDQAGIWTSCVSLRAPVIHNDYPNMADRKGLPHGHAPIQREIVVPIIRNDLIVMIIGVGNKLTDYDNNDIEILSQLASLAWDIIQRKQVEEELKRSERKYRLLHESMIDGFVSVDMDGNFLDCNDIYSKMLGYSAAELALKTYIDITPEKWRAFETDIVKNQIIKRGYSDVYEKEYIRKDGTIFPVELHTVLLRDDQGVPTGMWAIVRDITARKQAEEALRESHELFSLFMLHSPIYAFIKAVTPTESRVLQASDNFIDMVGISGRNMLGKTMQEIFRAEFAAKISADDWDVVSKGEVLRLDENLNGRHYTTIKFPIVRGDKTLLAGYTIDITERVQAEQALATALTREQELAHTDSLTGIHNRRHLYMLAEREFNVALRYQQPLSVIMFDIDHFKKVNDTFGHAAGDHILQRVTEVACAELRTADVIGRYGGEEFVIIMPMTNAQQALPLAERIRTGVEKIRLPTERGMAAVTLSIGIVQMTQGEQYQSVEDLIRFADQIMYTAKQAGRNRTEIGNR